MRTIALVILALVLMCVVDARMPKIGDYVSIKTANSEVDGHITDIENGLMCIRTSNWTRADGSIEEGRDVCVGIGSITFLRWFS